MTKFGKFLDQATSVIAVSIMFSVVGFGAAGWVNNIVHLTELNANSNLGLTVVRAAGIFIVPVGSVAGYFPNPQ